MSTLLACAVAAVMASAAGFAFHVAAEERLQSWIAARMKGHSVSPSRSVLLPAALASIESGAGLVVLYVLVRENLPFENAILRGLTVGFLVLAITGRLFRQPIMNHLIGNPLKVVILQDGAVWINWLLMCVVLAAVYEWLAPYSSM